MQHCSCAYNAGIWRSGSISPFILNFNARWRCGQLHRPATVILGKGLLVQHCIGGWVGLKAGLEALAKSKIS